MLPSQFKRLIETLHSRLSLIHDAVNKQERAIRDTSKSSDEKQEEISGVIAAALQSVGADVPNYEKAQRDKEYKLQRLVFWATLGAGCAAAIYAAIAAWQLGTMRSTYQEMQKQTVAAICAANNASKQTEILQKQIELEDGAVVAVAEPVTVNPNYVSATFINYGRSPAINLNAKGVLTKLSFPTGKTLWTKDFNFYRWAVPIPQSNGQQPADINMAHWEERFSGVSKDDEEDAAYTFKFTFSYFNGFRDTPTVTECHAYLSVRGVPEIKGTQYRYGGTQDAMPCIDLPGRMADADQQKRHAIKGQPQD